MPSHTPPCHEPFANAQSATASTAVLLVEGGVAALPLGLISSTAHARSRSSTTALAPARDAHRRCALSSRASLSQSQRSATLRQRARSARIQNPSLQNAAAECGVQIGSFVAVLQRRAMGYYNVTHACGAAAAVCSRILESGFWWSECRPPLRNTDTKCWTPGFWHALICTFTPPECGPALQNADFHNTTHDCKGPYMVRGSWV